MSRGARKRPSPQTEPPTESLFFIKVLSCIDFPNNLFLEDKIYPMISRIENV